MASGPSPPDDDAALQGGEPFRRVFASLAKAAHGADAVIPILWKPVQEVEEAVAAAWPVLRCLCRASPCVAIADCRYVVKKGRTPCLKSTSEPAQPRWPAPPSPLRQSKKGVTELQESGKPKMAEKNDALQRPKMPAQQDRPRGPQVTAQRPGPCPRYHAIPPKRIVSLYACARVPVVAVPKECRRTLPLYR